MKKQKKFSEWLKNPHGAWLIVLYVLTFFTVVCAILISIIGNFEFPFDIVAYVIYGAAAVLLGLSVYTLVKVIPTSKAKFKKWMGKYKFTRKFSEQYEFRTIVFTVGSFLISFAYATFNGAIGIATRSVWYIALAIYYLLLAVMRGGILLFHYKRVSRKDYGSEKVKVLEIRSYRGCGIMLILLPLCLTVIIAQMVRGDNSFHHYGLTLYVAAFYAFYKITMSIVNIVRAHKNDDYTVRAARSVNLSDALVSILALQTAMLSDLPSGGLNVGVFNAITGGAVCLLTVALGVYIIISSRSGIKRIQTARLHDGKK